MPAPSPRRLEYFETRSRCPPAPTFPISLPKISDILHPLRPLERFRFRCTTQPVVAGRWCSGVVERIGTRDQETKRHFHQEGSLGLLISCESTFDSRDLLLNNRSSRPGRLGERVDEDSRSDHRTTATDTSQESACQTSLRPRRSSRSTSALHRRTAGSC